MRFAARRARLGSTPLRRLDLGRRHEVRTEPHPLSRGSHMKKRNIFVASLALLVACSPPGEHVSARAQAAQLGHLDQLLAPIALYPDPLLAQILLSASDPAKVAELDAW